MSSSVTPRPRATRAMVGFAFRGQPAIRARFNKDILKRGRAAAGASTQPAPAPEQPVKK